MNIHILFVKRLQQGLSTIVYLGGPRERMYKRRVRQYYTTYRIKSKIYYHRVRKTPICSSGDHVCNDKT